MIGAIIHWDMKQGMPIEAARYAYQRFDYACRAFDAELVIIDADGTCPLAPPDKIVRSLEEALAEFPNHTPLYLTVDGGDGLVLDHVHAEDVVLIVGPDYTSMTVPEDARRITVDTPNKLELWADQALVLALHRYKSLMG